MRMLFLILIALSSFIPDSRAETLAVRREQLAPWLLEWNLSLGSRKGMSGCDFSISRSVPSRGETYTLTLKDRNSGEIQSVELASTETVEKVLTIDLDKTPGQGDAVADFTGSGFRIVLGPRTEEIEGRISIMSLTLVQVGTLTCQE